MGASLCPPIVIGYFPQSEFELGRKNTSRKIPNNIPGFSWSEYRQQGDTLQNFTKLGWVLFCYSKRVMLLLVAFAAIVIPLFLLVVLRIPAKYAMTVAALSVALLGATVWGMGGQVLLASSFQGLHRALTIIWILTGALLLLYVMQKTGAMDRIKHGFFKVSPDMRVQVVLIAFAFVAILEGVSGFGTPAAITVPLLVALGFRPMASVVLALAGDSVPTTFGALGTPLLIGLSNVPNYGDTLIQSVAMKTAIIDSLFGVLLPLILTITLITWFGRKRERMRDIGEILPWSLLVGASYVIATIAAVIFLKVEFASVLGGISALLVGIVTAKHGILQPQQTWRHHAATDKKTIKLKQPNMSLFRAWLPYGLVIGLLFIQRSIPLISDFSQSFADASWINILGIENISSQWQVLYSPGSVLMFGAIISALMFRKRLATLVSAARATLKSVATASIALGATLVMVQMFVNSGYNSNQFEAMPVYIAEVLAATFGSIWLSVAPFLGMIAAFIMGSSTVSTLTLAPVQQSAALSAGLPPDVVLAQQISGANAGNSIAVHNVVAASTVSGLHHQEGRIIRHTLPVALFYCVCTVLMTLLLVSVL